MLLVVCACCAVVLYRKVRPEAAKAMAAALLALTIIPAGYLMYDKCTTSEAVTYMSLAAVDDLPGQVGGGDPPSMMSSRRKSETVGIRVSAAMAAPSPIWYMILF